MAKAKAKTAATEQELTPLQQTLKNASERFVDVVVVGLLPNGLVDVAASTPDFAHINHLLSKAQFEMAIFEKSVILDKNKQTEAA